MLDRHLIEGRGDRPAIYYEGQVLTWKQVSELTNRVGNALLDLGVKQENSVMICLYDSPEFIGAYYGIIKAGAVAIPVTTMALPTDYLYYLNDSRAKVLITNSEMAPIFSELRHELRYLKHLVVVGKPKKGQLSFDELVKNASGSLSPAATSKDDMAYWLYSSETTGTPKGVVHLHHDLVHLISPHCTEVMGITQEDISFSTSKLYFSYGWQELLGVEILDGVGSTDVGMIYLSNKPGNVKYGSCGKLLTGFKGRLLDAEENEVIPWDIGTLWINNDGTTPCYWNKHEKTKECIRFDGQNTKIILSR